MKRTVLVCGGRDYADRFAVYSVLDKLWAACPALTILTGGARGADTLAADWARERGVRSLIIEAEWDRYGKAAGALRNQRMLDEFAPDNVIAFPGGRGTADMMARAHNAHLGVLIVNWPAIGYWAPDEAQCPSVDKPSTSGLDALSSPSTEPGTDC